MVRTLRIGSGGRAHRGWCGLGRSDLAKDIVEPPSLDPQTSDRPAAVPCEVGDFGNHRTAAMREDEQRIPLSVADRLDRRYPGQCRHLGPDIRVAAGRHAEAHRIVVTRALGKLCRWYVGEGAA